MSSIVVVNSEHFYVSIQEGYLSVVFIKSAHIPHCSWWLMKEIEKIGVDLDSQRLFHSIILDNDGLSIVSSPTCVPALQSLLNPDCLTLSPQKWKALIINVTGSAYEFPGAVYYLADILSSSGFSILHISTYESEVFLVQEQDIARACKVLKEAENPVRVNEYLDRTTRKTSEASNAPFDLKDLRKAAAEATYLYKEEESNSYQDQEDEVDWDRSWISPANKTIFEPPETFNRGRNDLFLLVLPNPVVLARLNGSPGQVLKTLVGYTMFAFIIPLYFSFYPSPTMCLAAEPHALRREVLPARASLQGGQRIRGAF